MIKLVPSAAKRLVGNQNRDEKWRSEAKFHYNPYWRV